MKYDDPDKLAELEQTVFGHIEVIANDQSISAEERLLSLGKLRTHVLFGMLKHASPDGKISLQMKESTDRVVAKLDEAEKKLRGG